MNSFNPNLSNSSPVNPNIVPSTPLPGKQKNETQIKEEVKAVTSEQLETAGRKNSIAYHSIPKPSLRSTPLEGLNLNPTPTGEKLEANSNTSKQKPSLQRTNAVKSNLNATITPTGGNLQTPDRINSNTSLQKPSLQRTNAVRSNLNATITPTGEPNLTTPTKLAENPNPLTTMTTTEPKVSTDITSKKQSQLKGTSSSSPDTKTNSVSTLLEQKISNFSVLKSVQRARSGSNSKTTNQAYPLDTANANPVKYSANSIKSIHQSGVVLIHAGARGEEVSTTQYLMAARDLRNIQTSNPEVSITMFQLYEKAADKYMAAGEVGNASKARSEAAGAVQFENTHPLFKMTEGIKSELSKQALPDVGFHMESGSSRIPEGLKFSTRPHMDGQNRDVLNCQLSGLARNELQSKFDDLFGKITTNSKNNTKEIDGKKLKEFEKSLPKSMIPVKVSVKGEYNIQGKDQDKNFTANTEKGIKFLRTDTYEIEFANGAKFTIGANDELKFIHERIQVEVPSNQGEGESLKQMQQILTVLGLGTVIPTFISTEENPASIESERQKYGLMLKTHFPQTWDKTQENPNYNDMSIDDLKMKMIDLASPLDKPGIEAMFKKYEENPTLLSKIEVFPGKKMWVLNDISEGMKKEGVYGFFSGTSIAGATAFLKVGQISTNERLHGSVNVTDGANFKMDVERAGSEGIFLRAVNEKVSETKISDFKYPGKVQALYDIKVINRGAVCYRGDRFGTRNSTNPLYQNRDNPIDFAKNLGKAMDRFIHRSSLPTDTMLNEEGIVVSDEPPHAPIDDPKKGCDNEVCIDGGNLGPEFLTGYLVPNDGGVTKQELLNSIKDMIQDIVYDGDKIVKGTVVFYGSDQKEIRKDINTFIRVADEGKFNGEIFAE